MAPFYVALFFAVFILIAMMWRYDRYRSESWYMLLFAAVLGAVSCWAIGGVNDVILTATGTGSSKLALSIVAGINEELIKVAIVVFIAWAFPWHFDDPMDGIVYGSFAGIGFALGESAFYVPMAIQVGEPQHNLFGQESIRAVLHYVTGGIGGFGVGLVRCRIVHSYQILWRWLAAAMLIHFLWNYACGLDRSDDVSDFVFQRTAAVCLMLAAIVLFRFAIGICQKWTIALHSEGFHELNSRSGEAAH